MHGNMFCKLENANKIGKISSLDWISYRFPIQEQEVDTKFLAHKTDKDAPKSERCDR